MRRRFSDDEIREAIRRVDAGFPWKEAARHFGMDQMTLRRRARALGIGRTGHRPAAYAQRVCVPVALADLVYLAALIDCEGHISKYEGHRNAVTIGVTNTDEPVMRWLASLGGSLHERQIEARKRCWCWQLQGRRDVLALLEAIEPHMRMKGEKARDAIRFLHAMGVISERAWHETG